ncbi:MAG TPA: hypothetical protein VG435_14280 [Acidimicrobiales bacterium]|nr:hypothetical protein [Acidimicrobiales bacterium]
MAATTVKVRRVLSDARLAQTMVVLLLAGIVTWATVVGLAGGQLPLIGWKSKGTFTAGGEALIGYGGVGLLVGVLLWMAAERVFGTVERR